MLKCKIISTSFLKKQTKLTLAGVVGCMINLFMVQFRKMEVQSSTPLCLSTKFIKGSRGMEIFIYCSVLKDGS